MAAVKTVQRAAVTFVQGVIQLELQLDLVTGLPAAAQAEECISANRLSIGLVVVAIADRLPAGADAKTIELAVQIQIDGATCPAVECVPGVAVTRVDDRGAEFAGPAQYLLLKRCLKTVDPCRADVLRTEVAVQCNRVSKVGAIQRCFQPAGLAQAAAPLQLVALGVFGLEIGVAEAWVIQIVEGRRAEAFAVGEQQIVGVVDRHGERAAPGVLAAELLVLVMPKAQFSGEPIALETMLNERGTIPAAVFVEHCAAVDPILVPVATKHQAVALVQGQVVLPVDRIAVSVEHVAIVAELVESLLAVFAVAQFQTGFPGLIDTRVEVRTQVAELEITVLLLANAVERDWVEQAERVVKLGLAFVIQRVETDFHVVVQPVAEVQAQRLVAVGVVVVIAGEGGAGTVDAGGFVQAGAEVEMGLLFTA